MSELPNPPEQFRNEGGRLVAGPDLSSEKGQSGFAPGLIIAAVFCLAFAGVGFLSGRATAPQPTFHEYAENLVRDKHCAPLLDWQVSPTPIPDSVQRSAEQVLTQGGMKNAEASSVSIQVAGKTYYIGIITWENCADG